MSLWSPPTAPRPSGLSADCDREVQWVEIFHSRPSWRRAYLQARVGDGSTWSNPRDAPLVDAGHIRDGFRVYRAVLEPGQTIRFVITNGTARDWDGPPDGADSFTIDHGGRYVVQHGLRHVGEADELECATAVFYPNDKFVTVDFVAELWENCFCAYSVDGNDWTQPPGQQMQLVSTAPRKFSITIPAKTLMFAFNNGGDPAVWDSNHDKNVRFLNLFAFVVFYISVSVAMPQYCSALQSSK